MVEDTPYFLRQKCSPKNLVFSDISFMAIFEGITPSDGIKVRYSSVAVIVGKG